MEEHIQVANKECSEIETERSPQQNQALAGDSMSWRFYFLGLY